MMAEASVSNNPGYFVGFIEAVWEGSIPVTVYDINPEVEQVANTVFVEIQTCSKRLLAVEMHYSLFWEVPSIWTTIASIIITGSTGTFGDWVAAIMGYAEYKACVLVAAVNWKSVMALALLGLDSKSDEEIIKYLREKEGIADDGKAQEILKLFKQALAVTPPQV